MSQVFEPVSQCYICGLDFYESEMVKHYKSGRLVDAACADEPGASDYLEKVKRPVEHQKRARQPTQQGYQAEEWATASIVTAHDATVEIVGDNRAGLLTVVGGDANEFVGITVIYGTAIGGSPTVVVTPYSPTSGGPVVIVLLSATAGFSLLITGIKSHVTYQWRYEVR